MVRLRLLAALVASIAIAAGARAASDSAPGIRGVGPRIGLTVNPDQIHLGAHLDFGNFARHVRFQPNLEVGVGDDVLVVAANMEAAYRFVSRWDVWSPYAGGGLGVIIRDDEDAHGDNDSNSDLGLSLLGGIERGRAGGGRFFMELKLGLVDAPDAKVTLGWTFHP